MNMVFKYIGKISLAAFLATGLFACTSDPNSPGVEYMPDMYRSPSFETYIKKGDLDSASFYERQEGKGYDEIELAAMYNLFKNGHATFTPPKGTVAMGFMPFAYENTTADYDRAGLELKNPLRFSDTVLAKGKELFEIYCDHCHGAKGEGDGKMVQNDKFPAPPSYTAALKDLPEGKIFFTMHYGKGMMGSHASQMSQKERWEVVYYVQSLQGKLAKPASDSTAVSADSTEVKN
ncbi:MAG: c-type cytochrome [Bacteroidetes bacterium]|nr:c-type cytochrome [Bacteroidota bacterium]